MPFHLLIGFVLAVVLAAALVPLVRRAALRAGAIDRPEDRRLHSGTVPRLGGVVVLAAVAGAGVLLLVVDAELRRAVLAAGWRTGAALAAFLLVVGVGALDDLRGLSPRLKLFLETLAAAFVVGAMGGVPEARLFATGETIALGPVGAVLGVLWIVALTNAVNMLDVADGVAAGTGGISAVAVALMAWRLGNPGPAYLAAPLAGALAGFLPYNLRRTQFLGDSGSLFLGFALASMGLAGARDGSVTLLVPLLLCLALPAGEVVLTVARRALGALQVVGPRSATGRFAMARGEFGFFVPDRRHIPHRLLDLGFSPRTMLMALCAVAAGSGALAVASVIWPVWAFPAAVGLLIGVSYAAPRWGYEELRLLDRGTLLPVLETSVLRKRVVRVAFDGAMVAVAWLLAAAVSPGDQPMSLLLAVVPATGIGLWAAGLYRGSYRHAGPAEVARAVRATVVGALIGLLTATAWTSAARQPALWVLDIYFLLTFIVGARLSFRILEYVWQRGRTGQRRVAIVGTDRSALLALRELLAAPESEMQPVGFLDEAAPPGAEFHGYPVLPSNGDGLGLVRYGVTDVVVPDRDANEAVLARIRPWLRQYDVRIVRFAVGWREDVAGPAGPDEE